MTTSICFLGTGKMNARHIRVVKKLFPKIRLAVASRDLARARDFQAHHRLDAAFASYADAIHSAFETIVIGVPPRYHADLVAQGLAAEKHLLIEKPVFQSLGEFKRLWPALERSKKTVMVAENQVFDPFYCELKQCLQAYDFGRPILAELTRLGVQKNEGWRTDATQMPLGALHEGGVHWIRKLLDLTALYEPDPYANVVGVTAYRPSFALSRTPGEDTSFVIARHRSGMISRLFHSWGLPYRSGLLDFSKILFEKGAVYFESRGLIGFSFGAQRKILWPRMKDIGGYRAMWSHFIHCVDTGTLPTPSLKDIFYDFRFLDAAYRSMASGKEEQV